MTEDTKNPADTNPDAPVAAQSEIEKVLSWIAMQTPSQQVSEDLGLLLAKFADTHKLTNQQMLVGLELFLYSATATMTGGQTDGIAKLLALQFHCIEALGNAGNLGEYLQLTAQGVPDAEARAAIAASRKGAH